MGEIGSAFCVTPILGDAPDPTWTVAITTMSLYATCNLRGLVASVLPNSPALSGSFEL